VQKYILQFWLAALLICIPLHSVAYEKFATEKSTRTNEEMSPSLEHMRTANIIADFLSRYHYRRFAIDDDLSASMFQLYIKSLDPTKSYFLSSDINKFSRYILNLDDALKMSDLNPAFEIFSVYQERVEERMQFAIEQLQQDFDFSKDEDYEIRNDETEFLLTLEEQNDLWRRRVKNDMLSLRLADKDTDEIKNTLTKRYENSLKRSQKLNANDVFQIYINAFTATIDPHTSYLSPRSYDNFEIRMSLSLEGIGAMLKLDDDYTVVEKIIPGGPADLGNRLHAKDKIIGIAQQDEKEFTDVIGWRLDEVVALIRGPKDSTVKLRIIPGNKGSDAAPEDITIVRNKIKLEEQAAQKDVITIEDDIKVGIINVPTFYMDFNAYQNGDKNYRSTTRDVETLLTELADEDIDSLVLDLRSNGGGSLIEATKLAGLFIDKGPVVQVRDSSGHIDIHKDKDAGTHYQGPMIVLVDRYSASASEIVSSALQDYGRAVVVGETTFGKGSVQQIIVLNQFSRQKSDNKLGQLKATIAQYFRVNGESTQHRGVIPDILFEATYDRNKYGERGLDNALPWTQISPALKTHQTIPQSTLDKLIDAHKLRTQENDKYQALLDIYAMNNDLQNLISVTLNQNQREKTFSLRDEKRKSLESIIGIENDQDEDDGENLSLDTPQTIETTDDDINNDILLIEAAYVSADLSQLWDEKQQRIIAKQ
jgi:carboxyl-terminal processing protease